MNYDVQSARNYLSNRKRAVQDVATPFWSEKDANGQEIGLDGHVQIRKLSYHEGVSLDKIDDDEQRAALLLSQALVLKDTGEQLIPATGLSMATDLDLEDAKALIIEIKRFNGLLPPAVVVDEKKESLPTPPASETPSS